MKTIIEKVSKEDEPNEIKIQIPEGFIGIDEKKSDLKNGIIVLKKTSESWRDSKHGARGFFISTFSNIQEHEIHNYGPGDYNLFYKEEQARSALAMAQLSQIIANDERFGGPITDEEWAAGTSVSKYVINRFDNDLLSDTSFYNWYFLAFHNSRQRDLFLEENEDLIKEYFMIK